MDQTPFSFSSDQPEFACIIVAGGSGSRCGLDIPKQFHRLGPEPVLAHAVRFFAAQPGISQIILVVPPDLTGQTEAIIQQLALDIAWKVTPGGARRQDSVLAGLRAAGTVSAVLIHDGARPFPPLNLIEGLQALIKYNSAPNHPAGVVFALPATDSIKRVKDTTIQETVPRADLWAMQTPQIFPAASLMQALEQCDRDGVEVTDDASAFEHMGWPVHVVPGSRSNIKITYAEDFIVAEAILKSRFPSEKDVPPHE